MPAGSWITGRTVAQDTGVPMGTLIGQTQTFGPVMKNLGLDANETATFFGKLNEAGVDVTGSCRA